MNRIKSLINTTEEVRKAFEKIGDQELFLGGSKSILDFISSKLSIYERNDALLDEIQYVLKRLISCLSSSKESMRCACFAILHLVLSRHRECLAFVLSYADEFYCQNKAEKGNDFQIGYLLTLSAIIRSGSVSEDISLAETIVRKLLALRGLKISVDFIVGQLLVHHLLNCKDKKILIYVWNMVKSEIQKEMASLSLSMMWLRVIFSRNDSRAGLHEMDPEFFQNTYSEKSILSMIEILKNLSRENVNISPLAEDIFKSLSLESNTKNGLNIGYFFTKGIHPLLKSSSPKTFKFICRMTEIALPYLTNKKVVKCVLSAELLEKVIHSQKLESESLSNSSKHFLDGILKQVTKLADRDDHLQIAYVNQLVSTSYGLQFEGIFTGINFWQQIIQNLNTRSIQSFSGLFITLLRNHSFMENDPERENSPNCDPILAVQLLGQLICHSKVMSAEFLDWRSTCIVSIMECAFFDSHPTEWQPRLNELYLRCLSQPSKCFEDQVSLSMMIVSKANELLKSRSSLTQIKGYFTSCLKCLEDVSGSEKLFSRRHNYKLIFQLLYCQIALCLFVNASHIEELLNEIGICREMVEKFINKSEKSVPVCPSVREATDSSEITFINLLLFILSIEEGHWRKVVNFLFKNVCHSLSLDSLRVITDVIQSEAQIMEGEEGENSDPEVEMFSDQSDSEETSESSVGDESDEDSSSTDDQKVKLMKLKMDMQKIVGFPMENDIPIDSVPEEELANLDKNLGMIMSQFMNIKTLASKARYKIEKDKMKDEVLLMHSKIRVCDLLATLVNEAPSPMHLVHIIRPIFLALEDAQKSDRQKPLVNRLRSILNDLAKVRKFVHINFESSIDLIEELRAFFVLNGGAIRNKLNKEFGICCTFILRCGLLYPDSNDTSKLFKLYADFVENSLKRDSCILDSPLLLETKYLSLVLEKVLYATFSKSKSVKPFKRKLGLEAIRTILSNNKAVTDMPDQILREVHSKLSSFIIEYYDDIQDTKKIQKLYLIALNCFLNSLKRLHKNKPHWESWFDWNGVASSLRAFINRFNFKDFKSLRSSLLSTAEAINLDTASSRRKKISVSSSSVEESDHPIVSHSELNLFNSHDISYGAINIKGELNLDVDSSDVGIEINSTTQQRGTSKNGRKRKKK